MADFEREFDWNDTIKNDNNFVKLEPGDYDFVIDHYDRARSQGSDKLPPCNMAIVYFNVKAPDGTSVSIRENFILHSKLEWKLSELFCSVGLKQKGEELKMKWDALPGMTGRCQVSLDPDTNDPSKKYNHIKKLYPKEGKKYQTGTF